MKLTLHVFYANFGMYRAALTAAESLAAERPELELKSWDVFDGALTEELIAHQILHHPTVRLYRDGVLLGESTLAWWTKPQLARWIDQLAT